MFKFIKWSLTAIMLLGALATARADDFFRGFGDFDGRKIGHVWIIVLENEGFDTTFGPNSPAPFLAQTLPSKGVMLNQYYATGHVSLDNYIAMVSGQSATVQTRVDCTFYDDLVVDHITPDGQVAGTGCVYPKQIKTIGDQLTAAGKSWKGYMEDMGKDSTREQATCGQPLITINGVTQVALNQLDGTQGAEKAAAGGDQYAARHNPFVYFHSLIDSGECARHVVNFNQLQQDLLHESTTPNFSFITPNLCHDGHDAPCKGTPEPGGLVSANTFLQQTVSMIMNSPAYKEDGLIIVTFDEAGLNFDGANSQITAEGVSCCGQQPGPNLAPLIVPGQPLKLGFENVPRGTPSNFFETTTGFGGDRTGAVLVSPFLKGGTVSNVPFNHYSMLRSVEDIFGLDHLGYAAQPGLQTFFGCTSSDIRVGGDNDQFRNCRHAD
jgi:phospholipase C